MMIDHGALAKEYFLKGYNCSQAVLLAFSDLTGLDEKTAMMMASSFVKTTALTNIPAIAMGFCALVMVLTFSMIFAGYAERKKK